MKDQRDAVQRPRTAVHDDPVVVRHGDGAGHGRRVIVNDEQVVLGGSQTALTRGQGIADDDRDALHGHPTFVSGCPASEVGARGTLTRGPVAVDDPRVMAPRRFRGRLVWVAVLAGLTSTCGGTGAIERGPDGAQDGAGPGPAVDDAVTPDAALALDAGPMDSPATPSEDGGVVDAGFDAATAPPDTGPGSMDAATTPSDAGTVGHDAAVVHPDAAVPPDVGPPPPPDFGSIAWTSVGYGVAYKDSQNPRGEDVFIGYAGYAVQMPWAQTWVTQLYLDALREHGVRHVYAVQGPRDALYAAQEIGNSRLVAHLLPRLAPGAWILVAAHSSGSFVAHELLGQLYERGLDPTHRTAGRVSYWDLDGGGSGLDATIVGQLHHAWFVWGNDAAVGTRSPNNDTMLALGGTYPRAGGAFAVDASGSGCHAGAVWCVHVTLITQRPHDPANADAALDYGSFDAAHRVTTAWLSTTGYGLP